MWHPEFLVHREQPRQGAKETGGLPVYEKSCDAVGELMTCNIACSQAPGTKGLGKLQ
jgi:hypothetical protein